MPPDALLATIDELALLPEVAQLDGAQLAQAVAAVSARYTREREALPEAGSREALCARLRFFLPRDFPKVQGPLAELAAAGALPRRELTRVLDLGSGLGATALGAAEYLWRAGLGDAVDVTAVDVDGAALRLGARVAEGFARRRGRALRWQTQTRGLEAAAHGAGGSYDLILLGLVLNEAAQGRERTEAIAAQAALLQSLVEQLGPSGAVIVVEPALRAQGRDLIRVRDALLEAGGGAHVFAPCLHRGPCPMLERERDWCHELLPLALPEGVAAIARAAGLRTADLTYSYLTLTGEPRSLAAIAGDDGGDVYRVVSGPLHSKGKVELLICDDGPLRRLRRLDRRRSQTNAEVLALGRGSIVRVTGGQAKGARREVDADTEVEVLHGVTM